MEISVILHQRQEVTTEQGFGVLAGGALEPRPDACFGLHLWNELDAGQIDVVCVCTPHPQHAEPLILAAERGIHGVVEKPFTATLAEADRVMEAVCTWPERSVGSPGLAA